MRETVYQDIPKSEERVQDIVIVLHLLDRVRGLIAIELSQFFFLLSLAHAVNDDGFVNRLAGDAARQTETLRDARNGRLDA